MKVMYFSLQKFVKKRINHAMQIKEIRRTIAKIEVKDIEKNTGRRRI